MPAAPLKREMVVGLPGSVRRTLLETRTFVEEELVLRREKETETWRDALSVKEVYSAISHYHNWFIESGHGRPVE